MSLAFCGLQKGKSVCKGHKDKSLKSRDIVTEMSLSLLSMFEYAAKFYSFQEVLISPSFVCGRFPLSFAACVYSQSAVLKHSMPECQH